LNLLPYPLSRIRHRNPQRLFLDANLVLAPAHGIGGRTSSERGRTRTFHDSQFHGRRYRDGWHNADPQDTLCHCRQAQIQSAWFAGLDSQRTCGLQLRLKQQLCEASAQAA
jgi:hypothetical protein